MFELPGGERHLAGWSCATHEGRATRAIVQFDAVQMRAVTASGRVSQLVGAPGLRGDGEYTWRRWCRLNEVDPERCRDILREL